MAKRNSPGSSVAFLVAHAGDKDSGACLIWPFHRHKRNGYGSAKKDGRTIGAHVLMCELAHGPKPFPEAEVAHSCGRGSDGCVHPKHVRWSTRSDNLKDKVAHGTDNRGTNHYAAYLTQEQVLAISNDRRPARLVAAEFGTTEKTVFNIRSGVSWSWLTGIRKAA